jgi:predicted acylesterase/phospholipase RssA
MGEINVINACKALKDRHYYEEALVILKKLESTLEVGSKLHIKLIRLRAECYYQNRELPANIRFTKALSILDTLNPEDGETQRLKGAIYKRKYQSGKNLEDLYLAISYYETAAQDVIEDEGYGAVNAVYLYYALITHLVIALGTKMRRMYESKIEQIVTNAITHLEKTYPTHESRQVKDREWISPTLAELYLSRYDYEKCNAYLRESHFVENGKELIEELIRTRSDLIVDIRDEVVKATKVDFHIDRSRFTTIEQLIKLYDLLPNHRATSNDNYLHAIFRKMPEEAKIYNIIHSVRIGKVGLALSGGGFRASLFHIGVLHRLAELDILRHVQVISSVSGGSIIAMYYYLKLKRLLEHNDNFTFGKEAFIRLVREVEKEFIEGVQTNIRMQAFVDNDGELTETLGRLYEKQLFSRTGDVPDSMNKLYIFPMMDGKPKESFKPHFNNFELKNKVPVLIINATSLNNGHNWRFTASGMGEVPHMYDMTVDKNKIYEYARYEDFPTEFQKVSIGKAVAASSAVPALFDPINMGKLYGNNDTIRLSDGGVYDNQGTAGLVSEECDIIITSDASKQLPEEEDPSDFRFDVVGRIQDILMNKTRDSEFKIVKELRRANRVQGLAILHLKDGFSNEVIHAREYNPDVMEKLVTKKDIREKLANIRTDLDAFHDFEAQALIQSGYEITAHWFDTYGQQEEWKYFDSKAKKETHFVKLDERIEKDRTETLRILSISSEVLFKLLKLYRLDQWIKYINIGILLWMLYNFYKTMLPLLGIIILAVAFMYTVCKQYLKRLSNWLLYRLLKPVSSIYLSCLNDLYLKKGKL